MNYWNLVEPVWKTISIHDGPEVFLQQYENAPEAPRVLFAAHWCQSEIENGGFDQFFFNDTGVLAPEAIQAFQKIGMPKTSSLVEKAVSYFGPIYPREWRQRQTVVKAIWKQVGERKNSPFNKLDNPFDDLFDTENGGFYNAADAYAASNQ
jgi:hypothetical protein